MVVAVGFLSLLMLETAVAQSDRGTLAGTILDSSGAVVSNAAITVTGADTGTVYEAVSGSSGAYRIPDIRPGAYNVKVAATGFKTEERTGVVIQVNTVSSLDITMQIGSAQETLTVVADAPTLQTESSDIGTVVDKRQIQDLPLALNSTGQSHLRSTESFVFLAPGTAGPGTNSDSPSSGIFESKLSGGQNFSTEVLLDGVSIVHAELGSTFDENAPSVEALNEFKVTTSTIPAEFGRTSGGVESFSTKSGANTFHGTAFDILRNDKLDANSWFNNYVGAPKPTDHQNDFGGSLGGPIWIPGLYNGRNKSFFFFSWEQYRNTEGTTSVTTLPTDLERTGDFSALLGAPLEGVTNPCDGTPVLKGQIFDPATTAECGGTGRKAFAGNIIPGDRISQVALNVLDFLQVHPNVAPNPGNLNGLISNFLFLSTKPVRDTTMTFRIDQDWGNANKFWFSYSSRDQEQLNGTPALPPPLDQNFFKSRFSHYIRFSWDRTISQTLLNHFTVGFNRLNDPSKGVAVTGQDWEQTLGITGASGIAFPQFGFGGSPLNVGYQGFGGGSFDNAIPNSLIFADSVSWVRGRHSLRMGFEWRHSQFSRIANANTSPNYSFENLQTAVAANDTQTGDPFASFLLGLPNEESLQISSHNPRWISNYYVGYIQDDFKFRRDLTFNIGFRYDVDTPRHEAEGAQSVLSLTTLNSGNEAVPISPSVPGALIYGRSATGLKTYYKDFAPRLGFAYAPEKLFGHLPNTVIRGGYGIYYSALSYSDFGDSFTSGTTVNPDFKSQDGFTSSPAQSLDAGFPSFTHPSNASDPSLLNGGFPNYGAAEYGRPGMIQNWSFEVQNELARDLILSVGYVGTRATRLRSNLVQVNSIHPEFYSLGTKLNDPISSVEGQATLASLGITEPSWFRPLYGDGEPIGQLLRPFPQFQSISSGTAENVGQSSFNALEMKLERRFRNGLNLLASYTFSKTLTDADSTFPTFSGFASNNFGAQNPFNLKTEKALSYQDTPHALVISYLYELPVGPGKKYLNHGIASKVLGGWQISGVHRYQSGSPVIMNSYAPSPPFSGGNFKYSLIPGVPIYSPDKASFNPNLSTGCQENTTDGTFTPLNPSNNYFNCAAFLDQNADGLVAQRGYTFGNLPLTLGNVRSDPYFSEDFAIIKRLPITESHVLSLKVDIPNAFNRHVFGTLDGYIASSTFGVPKGPRGVINARRQIQFTFRYQF
ncbi:MAG: carboxypeptidase-like regulatory domain-containing protein [Acidobacteriia bacterium]|nr:carboxypeptidase-like regulatory domain-containing protein [Terriglobia bacterium]